MEMKHLTTAGENGKQTVMKMVQWAGMLVLALATAASALNTRFYQLDWLGGDLQPIHPDSQVGEMAIDFDGTEAHFLAENGGAYINVVAQSAVQSSFNPVTNQPQWVVQNLYLAYPNQYHMVHSSPSVQFLLPGAPGLDVRDMWVGITVTDQPVPQFPWVQVNRVPVLDRPYLTGGFAGGGSALAAIPGIIGPWIGPLPGNFPVDWAWTWQAGDKLAAVAEDVNGCAPGSAARSIEYLGDVHGFATEDAQDIYDDLYDDMDTDRHGTTDGDMLDGKNEYTDDNDLPIETELVYGMENIDDVMDAINEGADVEILISWDPNGGHAAMITSITKFADDSYEITYVDDPTQGDGKAENEEHTIHVKPDGSFPGGRVDGFLVERVPALARFELDIERILSQWVDGFSGNGSGALMGHEEYPHVETETVHSGRQSLPFYYDNTGTFVDPEGQATDAKHSQIQRIYEVPQDWTVGQPDVLSCWIYGNPDNAPDNLFVQLWDCNGGYGLIRRDNPLDVQWEYWQQLTFNLTTFAEQGVDLSCVQCFTLGIGDPQQDSTGGRGMVLVDTIELQQRDVHACFGKATCALNVYLWDWQNKEYRRQGILPDGFSTKKDKTIRKVEAKRDLGETQKWIEITWKSGAKRKFKCSGPCPEDTTCTIDYKISGDAEQGWTVTIKCKCK